MAFAAPLVARDEEGEKLSSYSSVRCISRLQGGKHLCPAVCPQELHPRFHNKALAAALAQAALTSWHLTLSISGSSGAAAPRKAVNSGEPERARDETFRNQGCVSVLGFMSSERTKS